MIENLIIFSNTYILFHSWSLLWKYPRFFNAATEVLALYDRSLFENFTKLFHIWLEDKINQYGAIFDSVIGISTWIFDRNWKYEPVLSQEWGQGFVEDFFIRISICKVTIYSVVEKLGPRQSVLVITVPTT